MSTAETLVPHVPESTEQLPLPVGQGEQNIQVRVQHDVRELLGNTPRVIAEADIFRIVEQGLWRRYRQGV